VGGPEECDGRGGQGAGGGCKGSFVCGVGIVLVDKSLQEGFYPLINLSKAG
jgi:hypothetical protein